MFIVKPRRPTAALHNLTLRTLSSSSVPDTILVDRAISFLKSNSISLLDSLSSQFTPLSASYLLLHSQNNQNLILHFVNWAKNRPFLDLQCKCQAVHILTRFRQYKVAQSLVEDFAVNDAAAAEDESGEMVFRCLEESYHLCNSSSAVVDLVVKGFSRVRMIQKAINIISLAKKSGLMPTVLSYNAVIDAIVRTHGSVELAEEMYDNMLRNRVSPNVFTYNILIWGLCRIKELDRGLWLFNEMQKNGCLPNVVTCNTLIDGYCKLRRIDDAFGLMNSMQEKGLDPNLITFNVIINGLCREGRMKETCEVLEKMKWMSYLPDEVTYNTLVNGYCKTGDFHQALVLHKEMVGNGLSPNVVTYTSLINSMCKAGNLNRALQLFDEMHVRGLFPNERTYTTLIDGFSQRGLLDKAQEILSKMVESGFHPSIITHNTLINGYCLVGKMEDALGIMKDMMGKGLSPDVVSYSTIISGYCRKMEIGLAFQMKQEMMNRGIIPDAVTYSTLIRGLCLEGRLPDAFHFLQEMWRMGLQPDECTYTTLINGYCTEGEIEGALHLHDQMIREGLLPDVVTYSVLINGLNKEAREKEAKQALFKLSIPFEDLMSYKRLMDGCSSSDFKNAAALIKGFCMKGLMNEADKVLEAMIERSCKPSEAVYNIMIHGHSVKGNLDRACGLYYEMIGLGFMPHAVTVIALIKELYKQGRAEETSRVVENTLCNCKVHDAEVAKELVRVNHKEGNMSAVLDTLTQMARDGLLPNATTETAPAWRDR
ncbi:pentatricopeptide repeat-containing protein At5g39710 [Impatiens glandulifera]|uniref:pentatricopeptide repeat-containing protein At5g39710 n=1 Tax=Impatiens glandulifera TaxID=253017 RepID=UPI001FB11D96|nr:pentatricopeptide repeat-containing protein At5g39710 [Impatiens glandulifera]